MKFIARHRLILLSVSSFLVMAGCEAEPAPAGPEKTSVSPGYLDLRSPSGEGSIGGQEQSAVVADATSSPESDASTSVISDVSSPGPTDTSVTAPEDTSATDLATPEEDTAPAEDVWASDAATTPDTQEWRG